MWGRYVSRPLLTRTRWRHRPVRQPILPHRAPSLPHGPASLFLFPGWAQQPGRHYLRLSHASWTRLEYRVAVRMWLRAISTRVASPCWPLCAIAINPILHRRAEREREREDRVGGDRPPVTVEPRSMDPVVRCGPLNVCNDTISGEGGRWSVNSSSKLSLRRDNALHRGPTSPPLGKPVWSPRQYSSLSFTRIAPIRVVCGTP
jgi:hypothetical protein